MSSRRTLRSRTPALEPQEIPRTLVSSPVTFTPSSSSPLGAGLRILAPGSKLPGLSSSELSLLRRKQRKLTSTASATLDSLFPTSGSHLCNALESSLVFAQHEAGSAVCIDPAGWILTCAHCFGDTEEEYQTADKRRWLLFYTGLAVQVECRVWDPKRDLAILKVIAIESSKGKTGDVSIFRFVEPSSEALAIRTRIICIGQPGRDDLESSTARRTKYNLIEVSEGTFRGMVKGVDPQDNSEIGTLMHDAWTYWGHSGAPLLREENGTLIGLHSSWDDQTTMRHGVPLVALTEFLGEHLDNAKASL